MHACMHVNTGMYNKVLIWGGSPVSMALFGFCFVSGVHLLHTFASYNYYTMIHHHSIVRACMWMVYILRLTVALDMALLNG